MLDHVTNRIVRLEEWAQPVTIGRQGAGPDELNDPMALRVDADTIRVDDRGNARVLVMTTHGVSGRAYPVAAEGQMAFGPRGEAIVATLGLGAKALARRVDPEGKAGAELGELVVAATPVLDFPAMKAAVQAREVPAVLRNTALPVPADDGSAWLVLTAEGVVRKHAPDGRQLWSERVSTPEMQAIRDTFFARNLAEKSPSTFHMLNYFADAHPVGDDLWLLVNAPAEEPSVILVLGPDGKLKRRIVLVYVVGARDLALDPLRKRLYLTLPSTASVVAADVSEAL